MGFLGNSRMLIGCKEGPRLITERGQIAERFTHAIDQLGAIDGDGDRQEPLLVRVES